MSDQLHVFASDVDWVVAKDVADAKALMREATGMSEADMEEDFWRQDPDDATMLVWIDDVTGDVGDGGAGCTLVNGDMATWVETFGRGFLCSTEF